MPENTKTITIQGLEFEVSTPYTAGHAITEAEAKALNQVRLENIRNNMARVIAAEKNEDGTIDESKLAGLADQVAKYDAEYVFTLASVGGGRKSRDPVEVEATRLAKAAITGQLQAAGRKVKDVDPDKLAAAIAKLAESDVIVKAAKAAVKQRNALASTAMDELDL